LNIDCECIFSTTMIVHHLRTVFQRSTPRENGFLGTQKAELQLSGSGT